MLEEPVCYKMIKLKLEQTKHIKNYHVEKGNLNYTNPLIDFIETIIKEYDN
jgi:hypothetical protein